MKTFVWIIVVALVGCAESGPREPEMPAPLRPQPSTVLQGSIEPALFRIVDADVSGDTLYVAEQSSGLIRRFVLPVGEELAPLGGAGEGPGEFQRLQWVLARPGAVSGYDARLERLVTFRRGSDAPATRRIQGRVDDLVSPTMVGVLANDSIVVAAFPSNYERVAEGVSRTPTLLLGFSPAGELADTLGAFTGGEIFRARFGTGGGMSTPLLFGRRPFLSVKGDQVLLVGNESASFELFDGVSGRSDTIQPGLPVDRRPAGPEAAQELLAERRSGTAGAIPGTGALFDEMPIPDSMPYYGADLAKQVSAAHVTDSGEIWLLPYRTSADSDWRWIFGRVGDDWQAVILPQGSNLLHAGDRYLVLQVWDDLDVESIQVYDRYGW